jgi:hypothetical protein
MKKTTKTAQTAQNKASELTQLLYCPLLFTMDKSGNNPQYRYCIKGSCMFWRQIETCVNPKYDCALVNRRAI